jgi:rRNA small subunit pseudouridine methyltransferase Nep1
LALFDSPINKAGFLEVYIHTKANVLIKVSQHTRIPRTYKRFAGLMVQLLHKFKISASDDENAVLMKVIKNPVIDHLPKSAPKIGTSWKAEKVGNISISNH